MSQSALLFAWGVVAVGYVVVAVSSLAWTATDLPVFVVCSALAALASTFKVQLPGLTGTISPGFVFQLIAIARLSWSENIFIGMVCGLVQCLWRPKSAPTIVQINFNAATIALSAALAYGVAHGLAPGSTDPILRLAVAGVVLLVTNTLLVATILCLLKSEPIGNVWRALQPKAVPYYFIGSVLAGVWSRAQVTVGTSLVALVSVYLLHLCGPGLVQQLSTGAQPTGPAHRT